MQNHEEPTQQSIVHREASYMPPRSLTHWLVGRLLSTADALHEMFGKAIELVVFASDAFLSATSVVPESVPSEC